MALPELLTVAEVAKYLGLHVETVKRWIREGKLTGGLKFGNRWVIMLDKLLNDLLAMRGGNAKRSPLAGRKKKKTIEERTV
ncbi:MAG: Helix-turn-helix domain protein [Deltaproteobacteria bacterium ADurb.BinA014]|nr:MAG: Helix-turn-helix domain protein [Deltaproteobacteria bacterium ADurb.BinA014]